MAGTVNRYNLQSGEVRWSARWEVPSGADGKRRQRMRKGFGTKREAQRFLRDQLADLDRGTNHNGEKIALSDYLRRWLRNKRLRPTTRDNYHTALIVHVLPRIGGVNLTDVDHHLLDRLYRDLEQHGKAAGPCRTAGITCRAHNCRPERHDGLGTKSVQLVHGALRAALQAAVRDGRLGRNPADLAQPPKRTAAQRRVTSNQVWTAEQARHFLAATRNDDLHALWALALSTGMRRAELVGLTWADLQLDAGSLEIRQTTTSVRGKPIPSLGKTSAAHRRIQLDDPVPELLRRHRQAQQARHGDPRLQDAVFTDRLGLPLRPEWLTRRFQALARELELPAIGMHGLRHSAATLMLNNSVPVHIVASRLGHTDAATTLSVYVHVMPNDDRIAARAMSRVLFPDTQTRPE